ncbi:MAG TPA: ATP-binding protein [Bacteroidales bacterium]|nr:ATP-binding protein [Bacteroidales bacterium]HPF02902.1 ATP-binding protein [Bacteroidales bacterium]HPJ60084.1 ATP-binding protein [Bacteroidales bacterium]HPR13288.1 ATP-binding protein [Bacteroidales bacterium]HRW85555.1 ATP-binding protein [Bacteroidales bacterium]
MISKKLYLNIIIRVLLIVLLSLALGYLIFLHGSLRLSLLCALALIILTVSLISYLNRTNRNIRYFFDSVRNDDSNLSFPSDISNRSMRELNESMNNVNLQIQSLKIQNQRQEQYFSRILEQLATGIMTVDRKGFIHNSNAALRELLGAEVLTHMKQLERIEPSLFAAVSEFRPFDRKLISIITRTGEIRLSLKSTFFGEGENELMILSVQDIKHELDEKETDAWMKLIRVLMHEIMNSITPITSLSESLAGIFRSESRTLNPEEITERKIVTTLQGLDVIKEQGKGLMAFVESYRSLTRIPRPEKKKVCTAELFSRVKTLAGSLRKSPDTKIIFQEISPDAVIFADENLISQVLINLIKNALEANENNPACMIKVSADMVNSGLTTRISVTDNGPGISAENIEQIFIPFFTTRKNGSGIGLSVSRQIMNAHGGILSVISKPDIETTFMLSFRN